ncbi:MAG: ARMT1-like domain-containing protein [Eubacterium sp.]|nr:ARMT1-like domain-containing protein [Eubacterium sp.]
MRSGDWDQKQEVVRLGSDCMTCILKKELEKIPDETPEEQRLAYKQKVLRIVGNALPTMSPSEVTRDIHQVQRDMFGMQTDYPAIKSFFNQKMLQYTGQTEKRIREASDPLLRAIQFSMCGNYIDFGIPHAVSEEKLDTIFRESDQIPVREDMLQEIRKELSKARSVVFLHDNCGEIVMDKILIKEIRRQFPQCKVISVVRGEVVLNDATAEDAAEIGLAEVAEVLPNGDDVAGTCMERISQECRKALLDADVILAKGQGNFETMRGCGLNIYYLFLCKCELFRKRFSVPEYTGMVVHEREAGDY